MVLLIEYGNRVGDHNNYSLKGGEYLDFFSKWPIHTHLDSSLATKTSGSDENQTNTTPWVYP